MLPEDIISTENLILTFDGKKIEDAQSIEANLSYHPQEKKIKNGDKLLLSNKEYITTLKNIEISSDFTNEAMSTTSKYTVIGTGYNFPRGGKLPKKKRIRKKWFKKYKCEFKFEDCELL